MVFAHVFLTREANHHRMQVFPSKLVDCTALSCMKALGSARCTKFLNRLFIAFVVILWFFFVPGSRSVTRTCLFTCLHASGNFTAFVTSELVLPPCHDTVVLFLSPCHDTCVVFVSLPWHCCVLFLSPCHDTVVCCFCLPAMTLLYFNFA